MKFRFASEEFTSVRVREGRDKESKMIALIPSGAEFEGVEEDGWVKVEGYVMGEFLTPVETPTEEPEEAKQTPEPTEETGNGKLESMTVPELRKLAKDSGIKISGNLGKEKLIEAILNG